MTGWETLSIILSLYSNKFYFLMYVVFYSYSSSCCLISDLSFK